MINIHPLNEILQELIHRYCCHTVILYGSQARGDATESSDFDLMGIVPKGNEIIRDVRVWKGYALDAVIYPEKYIKKPTHDFLVARGGVVLIQKDRLGSQLLSKIERIYQKGPQKLSQDEMREKVLWAYKMLNRARSEDCESYYRRVWLLTVLLEDYFVLRGNWFRGPKESFLWLKKNEPRAYRAFDRALRPNATIEDIEDLIQFTHRDFLQQLASE